MLHPINIRGMSIGALNALMTNMMNKKKIQGTRSAEQARA